MLIYLPNALELSIKAVGELTSTEKTNGVPVEVNLVVDASLDVGSQHHPLLDNGYRIPVRSWKLKFETVEGLVTTLEEIIGQLRRDEKDARKFLSIRVSEREARARSAADSIWIAERERTMDFLDCPKCEASGSMIARRGTGSYRCQLCGHSMNKRLSVGATDRINPVDRSSGSVAW